MTATLPPEVQQVFDRFITTEFTTVDAHGQPITWPVTPYYRPATACIDVTTGLGYPKKANDARANPKVALLFSDPTGSGIEGAPQVLVQGTADVDDRDLDANRDALQARDGREAPGRRARCRRRSSQRLLAWYFTRIYIHVRPERVYVWARRRRRRASRSCSTRTWRRCAPATTRSPSEAHAGAGGRRRGLGRADGRAGRRATRRRGDRWSRPDGFPFSVRVPIEVDRDAGGCASAARPVGVPLAAGPRLPDRARPLRASSRWQRNFQVRGDLVEEDGAWAVIPRKLVGGFELPPGFVTRTRANMKKIHRFRKTAKRELAARRG